MKIKLLSVLIFALLLGGCINGEKYYILSTTSEVKDINEIKDTVIAVEKITVPKYLFKREIAVAKSPSEVIFLDDATWAEDLEDGLSRRLIHFLQKKFLQPKVYPYPWGTNKRPDIKVKVEITRFIAQNGYVYLEANWEINNYKNNTNNAKLFFTKTKTREDKENIVRAMHKSFSKLEKAIAQDIITK